MQQFTKGVAASSPEIVHAALMKSRLLSTQTILAELSRLRIDRAAAATNQAAAATKAIYPSNQVLSQKQVVNVVKF